MRVYIEPDMVWERSHGRTARAWRSVLCADNSFRGHACGSRCRSVQSLRHNVRCGLGGSHLHGSRRLGGQPAVPYCASSLASAGRTLLFTDARAGAGVELCCRGLSDWECDYTVSFTSLRSLLGWYHAIESTRSKSISSPSLDLGVLLVTFAAVCASGSLLFDVIALGVKPSAFVSIASVGGESCLYLFVLSLSSLVNAHAGPGAVGAVIP
jgi:hypothetical protein